MVVLSVKVPLSLYQALKEVARERGKSMGELAREALKEYLSRACDGGYKLSLEPFVKVQRPAIREVSSQPHPCLNCPSFRAGDHYCYALQKKVAGRECEQQ